MNRLRYFINSLRAKPVLSNMVTPNKVQRSGAHHDGPPQPFDNMPFDIPNRYAATVFFCVYFGLGMWAPYIIIWYSMAKKTL